MENFTVSTESPELPDWFIRFLNDNSFEGVDVDADISLFEYGFMYSEKYGCLIRSNYYEGIEIDSDEVFFAVDLLTKDEILEDLRDAEQGFYDFIGIEKTDYLKSVYLPNAIQDLMLYYGYYRTGYHKLGLMGVLNLFDKIKNDNNNQ